ncbi:SDR family oxidoreductase [Bordetella sp. N]|uniref:SDR family oxidoreductase n=1 Tax=Bordetella sp. N TaxID=1746199 RepID=UPI00070F2184|nr:SDR family oxidoreductase [Bordetella sp. N]ALM84540.1 NAD-dependent dehydratase [Bordetella sp. N]
MIEDSVKAQGSKDSVLPPTGLNILVCGARGFVGSALCEALVRAGHKVIKGVRNPSHVDEIAIDYARDTDPADWTARLQGIDVVINAVGILIEGKNQTFDLLHRRAPIALFDASAKAGVRRIVQISALGAQTGTSAYFRSKLAADEHLRALPVAHHILRPALVYGMAGASSRAFRNLATLPAHPLPAGGHQPLRPIHVDELAEIVVTLLRSERRDDQPLDLVGGREVTYRGMLATYRAALGFPPAWGIPIPAPLMAASAALLNRVPGSMLTRDTWRMLAAGNTADVAVTASVLGRTPAAIDTFIRPQEAPMLRAQALANWRTPLLRGALAFTWIATAICSAFIYPQAASLELLARVHLHGTLALLVLYLASALDLVLGLATLLRPGRRLWAAQGALILGYSVLIAIALPEYLWHPFGPILKNVPILALLFILLSEEERS